MIQKNLDDILPLANSRFINQRTLNPRAQHKTNWTKTGRILAMQTWKIGLHGRNGTLPPLSQLRIRFIWACIFVVFIPLLAYAGLRHLLAIPPMPAFGAALIWLILPWGFALLNPDRQFLYDFLAGTRLVDLKQEISES